ncbi:MAG: SOS response-associated peptidase family protein [Candidatus Omnitrophota bacterium]|nr:SOS response-associated peptidase family protein [Candidatus Omnitrophota bacterium]
MAPIIASSPSHRPDDGDPLSWRLREKQNKPACVHDRMPVILGEDDIDAWLFPRQAPEKLRQLLVPAAGDRLAATPVSPLATASRTTIPASLSPSGTRSYCKFARKRQSGLMWTRQGDAHDPDAAVRLNRPPEHASHLRGRSPLGRE